MAPVELARDGLPTGRDDLLLLDTPALLLPNQLVAKKPRRAGPFITFLPSLATPTECAAVPRSHGTVVLLGERQDPGTIRALLRCAADSAPSELARRIADAHELLCVFVCEAAADDGSSGRSLASQQWTISLDDDGVATGARVALPLVYHGRSPHAAASEPSADLRRLAAAL